MSKKKDSSVKKDLPNSKDSSVKKDRPNSKDSSVKKDRSNSSQVYFYDEIPRIAACRSCTVLVPAPNICFNKKCFYKIRRSEQPLHSFGYCTILLLEYDSVEDVVNFTASENQTPAITINLNRIIDNSLVHIVKDSKVWQEFHLNDPWKKRSFVLQFQKGQEFDDFFIKLSEVLKRLHACKKGKLSVDKKYYLVGFRDDPKEVITEIPFPGNSDSEKRESFSSDSSENSTNDVIDSSFVITPPFSTKPFNTLQTSRVTGLDKELSLGLLKRPKLEEFKRCRYHEQIFGSMLQPVPPSRISIFETHSEHSNDSDLNYSANITELDLDKNVTVKHCDFCQSVNITEIDSKCDFRKTVDIAQLDFDNIKLKGETGDQAQIKHSDDSDFIHSVNITELYLDKNGTVKHRDFCQSVNITEIDSKCDFRKTVDIAQLDFDNIKLKGETGDQAQIKHSDDSDLIHSVNITELDLDKNGTVKHRDFCQSVNITEIDSKCDFRKTVDIAQLDFDNIKLKGETGDQAQIKHSDDSDFIHSVNITELYLDKNRTVKHRDFCQSVNITEIDSKCDFRKTVDIAQLDFDNIKLKGETGDQAQIKHSDDSDLIHSVNITELDLDKNGTVKHRDFCQSVNITEIDSKCDFRKTVDIAQLDFDNIKLKGETGDQAQIKHSDDSDLIHSVNITELDLDKNGTVKHRDFCQSVNITEIDSKCDFRKTVDIAQLDFDNIKLKGETGDQAQIKHSDDSDLIHSVNITELDLDKNGTVKHRDFCQSVNITEIDSKCDFRKTVDIAQLDFDNIKLKGETGDQAQIKHSDDSDLIHSVNITELDLDKNGTVKHRDFCQSVNITEIDSKCDFRKTVDIAQLDFDNIKLKGEAGDQAQIKHSDDSDLIHSVNITELDLDKNGTVKHRDFCQSVNITEIDSKCDFRKTVDIAQLDFDNIKLKGETGDQAQIKHSDDSDLIHSVNITELDLDKNGTVKHRDFCQSVNITEIDSKCDFRKTVDIAQLDFDNIKLKGETGDQAQIKHLDDSDLIHSVNITELDLDKNGTVKHRDFCQSVNITEIDSKCDFRKTVDIAQLDFDNIKLKGETGDQAQIKHSDDSDLIHSVNITELDLDKNGTVKHRDFCQSVNITEIDSKCDFRKTVDIAQLDFDNIKLKGETGDQAQIKHSDDSDLIHSVNITELDLDKNGTVKHRDFCQSVNITEIDSKCDFRKTVDIAQLDFDNIKLKGETGDQAQIKHSDDSDLIHSVNITELDLDKNRTVKHRDFCQSVNITEIDSKCDFRKTVDIAQLDFDNIKLKGETGDQAQIKHSDDSDLIHSVNITELDLDKNGTVKHRDFCQSVNITEIDSKCDFRKTVDIAQLDFDNIKLKGETGDQAQIKHSDDSDLIHSVNITELDLDKNGTVKHRDFCQSVNITEIDSKCDFRKTVDIAQLDFDNIKLKGETGDQAQIKHSDDSDLIHSVNITELDLDKNGTVKHRDFCQSVNITEIDSKCDFRKTVDIAQLDFDNIKLKGETGDQAQIKHSDDSDLIHSVNITELDLDKNGTVKHRDFCQSVNITEIDSKCDFRKTVDIAQLDFDNIKLKGETGDQAQIKHSDDSDLIHSVNITELDLDKNGTVKHRDFCQSVNITEIDSKCDFHKIVDIAQLDFDNIKLKGETGDQAQIKHSDDSDLIHSVNITELDLDKNGTVKHRDFCQSVNITEIDSKCDFRKTVDIAQLDFDNIKLKGETGDQAQIKHSDDSDLIHSVNITELDLDKNGTVKHRDFCQSVNITEIDSKCDFRKTVDIAQLDFDNIKLKGETGDQAQIKHSDDSDLIHSVNITELDLDKNGTVKHRDFCHSVNITEIDSKCDFRKTVDIAQLDFDNIKGETDNQRDVLIGDEVTDTTMKARQEQNQLKQYAQLLQAAINDGDQENARQYADIPAASHLKIAITVDENSLKVQANSQDIKDCLKGAIVHNAEAFLQCPYNDESYLCYASLQDREIKAKSLSTAESQEMNSFHCKTLDCQGWCIYEDHVNFFKCPVCNKENCLTCKAIHKGVNCQKYQDDLQAQANDNAAARRTRQMLSDMVKKGEAMHCPQCKVILHKKEGCDWLKCSICKTEICWVTKGPRWGSNGPRDISGGCRCRVNGEACHPGCNNCH